MYEPKEILEWFECVRDNELRRTLIKRTKGGRWDRDHDIKTSLAKALEKAFPWGSTPEGREHWKNLYDDMKRHPEYYLSTYYKDKEKLNI